MAATRSRSGISKPRQVAYEVSEAIKAPKTKAVRKIPAVQANESKPRTKAASKVTKPKKLTAPKVAIGSVVKKSSAKQSKAKPVSASAEPNHVPTLMEKVEGVALTVQGYVMGKPGKKAAGTAKIRGTSRKGISKTKSAKASF